MPTKPTIVAPKTGSKKRVETCRQRGTSTVQPLVACARGSRRIGSASNASGVKTKTTQNSRRLAIFFCPRSGGSRHKPGRQQHFFCKFTKLMWQTLAMAVAVSSSSQLCCFAASAEGTVSAQSDNRVFVTSRQQNGLPEKISVE